MNSSDFFRAHWSRHLCCKALVDRQAHVQPTSPSIYIEGTSSLITLSPSLVDPAIMSVVREVDGQETGLSVQPAEKKNRLQTGQDFIYRAHWPRLLKHQPAVQHKRTRPLTSYPVSQSRAFTKLVTCSHRPVTKFIT